MGTLNRPYEITLWNDVWDSTQGKFIEQRVCVIGSNKMRSQNRALRPTLTRNVNGEKKFSFEMYKQYIDTVTGEKVHNPFVDELVSERKIKLYYDNEWYDFIVKDVQENSSTYLNKYELQDALVQELAKNGFGVTLDTELMNNIGDTKELGTYVLRETDWTVESDVIVQKIEEPLVYIELPNDCSSLPIRHIKDQTSLSYGVREEVVNATDLAAMGGKTILAFYSSCKNKPHRFQFIYTNSGDYSKDDKGKYKIKRNDKRIITEPDCQYYIDFASEADYTVTNTDYDLSLPTDFAVKTNPYGVSGDTTVSTWYRGHRYGYAQQAQYIPLLERYCQKFKTPITNITLDRTILESTLGDNGSGYKTGGYNGVKNAAYDGLRFSMIGILGRTYVVSYDLEVVSGTLKTIGGHSASYRTKYYGYNASGDLLFETTNSVYTLSNELQRGGKIKIYAEYTCINNQVTDTDATPYIYIQPNRGLDDTIGFDITNLTFGYYDQYLGYTESEFVSPTLIQNHINNPTFTSEAGWVNSKSTKSSTKPTIEAVYGRFSGGSFINVIEDLANGNYLPTNEYSAYLKTTFSDASQFILNSGVKDNRTMIGRITNGEQWVLDYDIKTASGEAVGSDAFTFDLGDYSYSISGDTEGCYVKNTSKINFTIGAEESVAGKATLKRRTLTAVNGVSPYTEETFKKNSTIHLSFKPSVTPASSGTTYYIKAISLYKKSYDKNNQIIVPDYEEQNSLSAQAFVESGVIEKKYNYFKAWDIDSENASAVTNAENLALDTETTLTYSTYIPVYNEGAKKIRTISQKESNYFNILQTIAETFEQWLKLEVTRDSSGAVTSKKVAFRNYSGEDNYACFRYGVNLKDISRTTSSKNIVTKLYVKPNSNELAPNGFCSIARAGVNPTGESYIYDFQYYQNIGLMNPSDYLNVCYYTNGARGPDHVLWQITQTTDDGGTTTTPGAVLQNSSTNPTNLNGYYHRIRRINSAIEPLNESLLLHKEDLTQRKSELELARETLKATTSGIEEVSEKIAQLTGGLYPTDITNSYTLAFNKIDNDSPSGVYTSYTPSVGSTTVNGKTVKTIELTLRRSGENLNTKTVYFDLLADLTVGGQSGGSGSKTITLTQRVSAQFVGTATTASVSTIFQPLDMDRKDIQKYVKEYATYLDKHNSTSSEVPLLENIVNTKQATIRQIEQQIKTYKDYKIELNKLFFNRYSRFIQEGSWINEEYVDEEKYYTDAQSVLYNSCYPQVAYSINVLALNAFPGYEDVSFGLGDKTYVIDEEFFATEGKQEVVVTQMVEDLDDVSQDKITVQNFKNQFQDLFQKITATTQQVQYSVGSYEKGAAFVEASEEKKNEFVTNALNNAVSYLAPGKSHSVTWEGGKGITVQDVSIPTNQVRIVGGAILLGKWDATKGQQVWRTGLTSEGISADLITAGEINTGKIVIKHADQPMFKWDENGITAYSASALTSGGITSYNIDSKQFTRFDRFGFYGVNHAGIDGETWTPETLQDITDKATFALTWEGLKVGGNSGVVAKIGKNDGHIINITKDNNSILSVSNSGDLFTSGDFSINTDRFSWKFDKNNGMIMWSGAQPNSFENYDMSKDNNLMFRIYKENGEGKFWMKGSGEFTGTIAAEAGSIGKTNKWNIGDDGLWCGGTVTEPNVYLGTIGKEFKINSIDRKDLIFKAGENFGLTDNGILYASNGVFTGEIIASGGRIGNWDLENNRLGSSEFGLYTGEFKNSAYTTSNCVLATTSKTKIVTRTDLENTIYYQGGSKTVFQDKMPSRKGEKEFVIQFITPFEEGEYEYDIDFDIEECFQDRVGDYRWFYVDHITDKEKGILYIRAGYENLTEEQSYAELSFNWEVATATPITTTDIPNFFVAEDGYVFLTHGQIGNIILEKDGFLCKTSDKLAHKITAHGICRMTYYDNGNLKSFTTYNWDDIIGI